MSLTETCPTVRVASDANESGFVVINESDFDPDAHALFGEDKMTIATPMTVSQMREILTAKGVSFESDAKKSDLRALLAVL